MNHSKILNIDPKGKIVCYDKNGKLRDDLNVYQLSKQDQLKIFGEVIIYDEKHNSKVKTDDTEYIDAKVLQRKLGFKGT